MNTNNGQGQTDTIPRDWPVIRLLEQRHYGCGVSDGRSLAMGDDEIRYVHLLTQGEHPDASLRGGLPKADCYRRGLRDGFAMQAAAVDRAFRAAADAGDEYEAGDEYRAGPPVTADAHRTLMEMISEPRCGPARDWRRWADARSRAARREWVSARRRVQRQRAA